MKPTISTTWFLSMRLISLRVHRDLTWVSVSDAWVKFRSTVGFLRDSSYILGNTHSQSLSPLDPVHSLAFSFTLFLCRGIILSCVIICLFIVFFKAAHILLYSHMASSPQRPWSLATTPLFHSLLLHREITAMSNILHTQKNTCLVYLLGCSSEPALKEIIRKYWTSCKTPTRERD